MNNIFLFNKTIDIITYFRYNVNNRKGKIMSNIQELKTHLCDYLNEITEKSKNKMYVCPLCKSGTGQHKTGAFNIIPSSNGTAWKCHSCGRGGTIIDLYSMINNIDTKEAIKQLLNKYNTSSMVLETPQALPEQPRKKVKDYTNFFRMAERNINQTNYLKDVRKISQETISFFHCGYIPKFSYYDDNIQKFTSAIIIPTSDNSYMWRSTQNNEKRKQGKTHLLNTCALYQYQDSKIQWHNSYCVIVEGELDCLSVFDVDKNVIGLGSVNMVDTLIQTYCDIFHGRQQQYCPLLIFALDNDEVGRKWTDTALLKCNKHNIACISADVQKLYGGHKDANEMIVKSNSLELKNNLEKEILKMFNQKYNYRPNDIIKKFQVETSSNNNMVAHRNGNGNNSNLEATSRAVPDWYNLLRISQKGNIISSLHNINIILQNDDTYKGKIEYNELTNMRTFNRMDWEDVHESMIKLYLEEQYNLCVSVENINHVCNILEHNNRYHPIKEHLSHLKWDGVPRINTVFSDFLGAKNNIYTQKVASITFIGAIARIFQPGIKYDTCTVFVGRQGLGKSKFISKLAINQDWFTDGVTTFDGKEFYESIQGKWLIELGEGTAFQKSIKERSKQAIASQQDSYRKPYARNPVTLKRQCIFFGTTNNYDFLKDETGDRRYYPIDVDRRHATKNMDTELTPEYVNQLWAEALERYRKGEEIYITDRNILAMAEQEQRNHFDESPLQSDIFNFLDILLPPPQEWYNMTLDQRKRYIRAVQDGEDTSRSLGHTGVYKRDRVSVKEVMCELYGYELNQPIERKISLDVARSLTALGWNKTGKTEWIKPYGNVKIYYHN